MNLKLSPADVSAIEQREKDKRVRMYDELTGFGTSIADPKSVDFMNLIHDWRVLSQRVQELEKVLRDVAYLPDGTNTFDAVVAAREVLNKK